MCLNAILFIVFSSGFNNFVCSLLACVCVCMCVIAGFCVCACMQFCLLVSLLY